MKISVIVPVYNAENYLNYCVHSIINQTYKDIELILVDDGSTDISPKLCDDYGEKYDFIKVFHKENGGQCSARNLGIKFATGDYFSFVDNDDFIHPQYYEIMAEIISETNCEICVANRKKCNSVKEINCKKIKNFKYDFVDTKDILFDELVDNHLYNFIRAFHTKIVKKSLFEKYIFNENLRDEEDTLLISQFYSIVDKIAFVDENLYFSIQNKFSITRTDKNKWKNIYYLIECRKFMVSFFKDYKYIDFIYDNFVIYILREIALCYKDKNEEFNKVRETFILEFSLDKINNKMVKYLFSQFKKGNYSFFPFMKFIYSFYKRELKLYLKFLN